MLGQWQKEQKYPKGRSLSILEESFYFSFLYSYLCDGLISELRN